MGGIVYKKDDPIVYWSFFFAIMAIFVPAFLYFCFTSVKFLFME